VRRQPACQSSAQQTRYARVEPGTGAQPRPTPAARLAHFAPLVGRAAQLSFAQRTRWSLLARGHQPQLAAHAGPPEIPITWCARSSATCSCPTSPVLAECALCRMAGAARQLGHSAVPALVVPGYAEWFFAGAGLISPQLTIPGRPRVAAMLCGSRPARQRTADGYLNNK